MGDSRSFGDQAPQKAHLVRGTGGLQGEVADLRRDTDDGFVAMEAEIAEPGQAQANLELDIQATEGDTILIGADTYELVDALGAGIVGGAIEVLIGGSAAQQLLNMIATVNGLADAAVSPGAGTEAVLASAYNTDFLHIEHAQRAGGALRPGPKPGLALSETLTDDAEWDHHDLGRTGGDNPLRVVRHVINVDPDNLLVDFDIVVGGVPVLASVALVTDSSDVPDGTGKAASIVLTIVQARNAVTVDLDSGGTDTVDTDKVYLDITYLAA